MRTFLTKTFFFVFFVCLLSQKSMAWGLLGHRIIGAIAEQYLTEKTRTEIRKILGNETIAMASNWADFIKSDSTFDYLEAWHYIDLPEGLTYPHLQSYLTKDTAVDIYTGLNFLVKELKKKSLPKNKKVQYLRLLIHFVGDINQPLHIGFVGFRGGNDIKLNWFSTPTNLHRVWDSHLIEFQQLSYTEYAAAINFPTTAEKKSFMSQSVSQWLFDSNNMAKQLKEEITTQNPRLGYEYNYSHLDHLNRQLLKGGLRLAGLLNSIFDK
jgi:hypothetical protein